MENLKNEVILQCKSTIATKLNGVEAALQDLQEAMHSEEKSSAGDKYETGRAMIQLEMENISGKVTEYKDQLKVLKRIKEESHKIKEIIGIGSLVETATGMYFLAVSLGAVKVNSKQVFVISTVSPIGELLVGKKAGDTISFRGQNMLIKNCW